MTSSRFRPLGRLSAWFSPVERRMFAMQLGLIFVVITLLSLASYYQRELVDLDRRQNLQRVVRGWDGLAWYVWLLAAPATLMLVRTRQLGRAHVLRSAAWLSVGSVGIFLVITNLRYGLRMLPNLWRPPGDTHLPLSWANYTHTQSVLLPIDLLTYCGIFVAAFALDYYFKYRRRTDEILRLQLQAARLQTELATAQLAVLRGQLHPHFLFNAFNAISTLVRQQKNQFAIETISRLGDMLRVAMENFDRQEVTVGRELDFVRSYLGVESVRFGAKLQTDLEVDSGVLDCMVPSLLLQPLVENAIKHGISRRVTPGLVRLTAVQNGDRLLIAVIDDGPEVPPEAGPEKFSGLGLRNTRRRLESVYGEDYRLDIARRPEGGVGVHLNLPWRKPRPLPEEAALAEKLPA